MLLDGIFIKMRRHYRKMKKLIVVNKRFFFFLLGMTLIASGEIFCFHAPD